MNIDCCCKPLHNLATCGCCEGIELLTPLAILNRPGLLALSYRIGTHATFLESMKARLSNLCLGDEIDCRKGKGNYPLRKLTTREADDFSIAMLDAWATVGDVLTFYQERIANEGYLRTAIERRSVLEMARLVGYKPRPGVSASVYLAYTIDPNYKEETVIPAGSHSQSIPGPGELPQSFETSEDLKARAQWNNLVPRLAKPQNIKLTDAQVISKVYVDGITTNLKPNDPILLVFGDNVGERIVRFVETLNVDSQRGCTEIALQEVPFLIIAATELWRAALAQLDRIFKNTQDFHQLSQNGNNLVNVFSSTQGIFREWLENFSLGDYLPIHITYFNHERIYGVINQLGGSNLLRRTEFGEKQFSLATIHSALEVIFSTEIGGKFIGSILNKVISILENPSFQHNLICLARYILQQAMPTDLKEREVLKNFLAQLIPSFQELSKQLQQLFSTLINSKAVLDKLPHIQNELVLLLRDPGLHSDLNGFLNELLALYTDDSKQKEFIIFIQEWLKKISLNAEAVHCGPPESPVTSLEQLINPLIAGPSLQPANSSRLSRNTSNEFSKNADAIPQVLVNFNPHLRENLYVAWANASVQTDAPRLKSVHAGVALASSGNTIIQTDPPQLKSVHALRLSAPLFGYNAPVKMGLEENLGGPPNIKYISVPDGDWTPADAKDERADRLYLDNAYEGIMSGAYMLIRRKDSWSSVLASAESVTIHPRTAYGISAKTTEVGLSRAWWGGGSDTMDSLRKTLVHAETEKLALALEPDNEDVAGDSIDLMAVSDGIVSGRWVVVSGERSDIHGTTGVRMAELAMISSIEQVFDKELPGDKTHTRIKLAEKLAYRFKRDTVRIYGNVVKATHGETRTEVLGSGDGSKPLQQFNLKQPPLTFVPASNPSGVDSTLKVYVNDVQWYESETLVGLGSGDRRFVTRTDDDGKTAIICGNGNQGARLPTGIENIRAVYRNGIGKGGNVKAEQISLLSTRPLGAKEVINPLPASGGADKETRDQARKNAPLAVMALDRLVSVQDYEDFTRVFAGIGKARAVEISDGHRQIVHLTIAGVEDIPIETHSDLYRNLTEALRRLGDPYQPFRIELRELMLLVLSAKVRIQPDYLWEKMEPKIRATLQDVFSFERRELGQDALLSEAIAAMQSVRGVSYVDVDSFGGIPEKKLESGVRRLLTPAEIADEVQNIVKDSESGGPKHRVEVNLADYEEQVLHPAQLAYFTPLVPATLILNEVPR